jgi:hypothetical protein
VGQEILKGGLGAVGSRPRPGLWNSAAGAAGGFLRSVANHKERRGALMKRAGVVCHPADIHRQRSRVGSIGTQSRECQQVGTPKSGERERRQGWRGFYRSGTNHEVSTGRTNGAVAQPIFATGAVLGKKQWSPKKPYAACRRHRQA